MNHCGDSCSHMTSRPQDDLPACIVSIVSFTVHRGNARSSYSIFIYRVRFGCVLEAVNVSLNCGFLALLL